MKHNNYNEKRVQHILLNLSLITTNGKTYLLLSFKFLFYLNISA